MSACSTRCFPGASTWTIPAIPTNVPSPELWRLGSGDSGGAVLAAAHGLGRLPRYRHLVGADGGGQSHPEGFVRVIERILEKRELPSWSSSFTTSREADQTRSGAGS
jgi:hypothetical protein